MNQYRCTRPDAYDVGCPGHEDVTARQGHYIYANDVAEAYAEMEKWFPDDTGFNIQPWEMFDGGGK